jgi:hypothetical protein
MEADVLAAIKLFGSARSLGSRGESKLCSDSRSPDERRFSSVTAKEGDIHEVS